jgi:hypothetical protein
MKQIRMKLLELHQKVLLYCLIPLLSRYQKTILTERKMKSTNIEWTNRLYVEDSSFQQCKKLLSDKLTSLKQKI